MEAFIIVERDPESVEGFDVDEISARMFSDISDAHEAIRTHEDFTDADIYPTVLDAYSAVGFIARQAAMHLYGEDEVNALCVFLSEVCGFHYADTWDDFESLVSTFHDAYLGTHDSSDAWAEEFLRDTGGLEDVPDGLLHYIDFASWARDAEMSGGVTFCDVSGGIAVFSGSW